MNIYCVVAGDHPTAFVKDSGMLPYYLHLLTDYDVFFVSHVPPLSEQNNERKESYERVQGMKCIYVPCKNKKLFHGYTWATMWWIWKNAKKIDILHLWWLQAVLPVWLYKIRNPKGIVWKKCDLGISPLHNRMPPMNTFMGKLKNKIIEFTIKHYTDCLTAESTMTVEYLQNRYTSCKEKIKYLPSGVDDIWLQKHNILPYPYEKKENLIIHVARLGTAQKNTEFLLECMEKTQWQKDWKIIAVATYPGMTPEFAPKLEAFFEKNSHLRHRLQVSGELTQQELFGYYQRAKIVCCTSVWESFGLFIVEGLSMGDYVLTTPICTAPDFIQGGCGVEVQTPDEMASFLSSVMADETTLHEAYPRVLEHAKDFYWSNIIKTLQQYANE